MKRILILVLCLAFLWTILPMEIKAESSSPPEGSCISPSLSIEVSNITEREATLSFTANTDGTIYYLLQEAGAKTPEEAALLTGATLSLTADIESAVPLEGLIPQTDYSVYALFNDSMEGQSAMGSTAFATQTGILAKGTVLPMASSPNDYIFDISEGPITINKADGAGMLTVSYGNPTQTTAPFANSQYITITGTSTSNGIKIDELLKTGTNIILKDVNIDQSSNNESAFNMNGANVNLTLIGTNSLKSGIERAGLGAPDGSTLIIDGSGSLEATGKDFGAGIGGGLRQNGGTIKVTGGTIIATGGIEAAGIGGGYKGSGGSAVITGGSVKASGASHDIQGIPTNGETNGSLLLRLAEFELSDCPQGTQILDLTITGAPYYGTKDLFVDSKSKLYLWLSAEASALCAKISEDEYYNIPVVFSTNAEKPEIFSLTPSGTGAALSGDLVITFNMQMRSGAGTVFLNGSALTGGVWDENLTVFTIPYSSLPYSKECVIKVSGFKNFWGDVMDDDEGHSFFTKAAPVSFPAVTTDPAISEITDSEATVSGRVTSDGGAIVSERGFIFSTTANPRINGLSVTKVIAGQGLGDYAVTLTGLMPDTVYTVAAYAINIAGIAYGEDVTFTSLPEPEPKPAPGSDYIFRTLTDSMTGISLSGTIHKDALLTVESINLEDDPACQTIRQYMKDDNYLLLLSKNISLTEDFAGELTMTIPVDSTYNGKIVTILHCVEGTLKTYTATVTDGKIAFNITSLSPFAVFVKAPSVTPDDPYEPNEHITIPKTGESSPARQGWLLLNISAAALVSLLILKKRRKLTDC